MAFQTLNPATEELVRAYPELSQVEAETKAQQTFQAFLRWRRTPFSERGGLFQRMASELKSRKAALASIMTEEMGKPIRQAETEIEKCAWGCEFYAENSEKFLKEEIVPTDARRSSVRYDPLGVVLAIMPWNFPFWQVFRCAVPALIAGNGLLLKHAPNVPTCALAIEGLFNQVGFPDGLFRSLFVSPDVVARLIESPWVQAVSLTGSDRAGSAVAAVAGRALKKTVLELGGSDPFVVLRDADLDRCTEGAVRSRMLNAGQSCIAAKRMIVVGEVAPAFEKKLVTLIGGQRVGDPRDPATDIGPIARRDLLENLIRQVDVSISKGAERLLGGERLPRKGFFFQPTVLKSVAPGMPAFDEETFGPVASLVIVRDEEEAITMANRTPFGLGASLWTRDVARAEVLSAAIEAGSVFVNGMVKSDPRLPFGGIKRSGYGRELSLHGIREFTNIKTIWIA